jgi:RNA polymerase sigma-70 factor (ECF subfamily)
MKAPHGEPDGQRDDTGAASATPASLLLRLRSPGDEAAWEQLLLLYGPTVERWCRRAGLTAEDAADVGQEVFQAVARSINDFHRDRPGDSFRGWLYAITRTRLLDHRRARHIPAAGGTDALHRLEEIPAEEPADSDALTSDRRELYQRAVRLIQAEFAERTWQAFWRVTVEGQSPADVAADLGLTPGAVYIAKSRVLKRLRQEFDGLF